MPNTSSGTWPRNGSSSLSSSGDGGPLPVKEATLALSQPGQGAEPVTRKATLGADGFWHVGEVPITSPGRWHLRIEAVTVFRKITLEDDFEVTAP